MDIGSLKALHHFFHSRDCKLQILIFFFFIYGQHVHAWAINYSKNENLACTCNFHLVNESYCVCFLFI